MEALLFILLVILGLYTYTVSGRVKRLEAQLRGQLPVAMKPTAQGTQPMKPVAPLSTPMAQARPVQSDLDVRLTNISGTQLLTGIGLLAVLFGLGFFFKYAIEQGWISELGRVVIGLIVGGLFIILGNLWRQKHEAYARLLTGGGLAILYFSIYAAYQYYQLLDQSIAGLIMILITALGAFLAHRSDSKGLMVFALFGGFLSPIMLRGDTDRHVAFFVYLTVLNAGVLALMAKRYWMELAYTALIGTVFNFVIWAGFADTTFELHTGIFLVINMLLMMVVLGLLYHRQAENKQLPEQSDIHLGALTIGWGLFYFFSTIWLLSDLQREYIAPMMLLGGIISFIAYTLVDRLNHERLNYCMSFVGSALIASAIGWQFSGKVQDLYFLVASLIGIGIGLKVGRKDLRAWGLILLLIAAIKAMTETYTGEYTVFLNTKFGLEILFVIGLLVAGYWYRKSSVAVDEAKVPHIVELAAMALIWFGVSEEIIKFFGNTYSGNVKNLVLSLWWIGYAVVLGVISALRKDHIYRKASVVLFSAAILKVFLYDVQALDTGYRIVSFIVLGVILLIVAFSYQKHKDQIQEFWKGSNQPKV